MNFKQGVWRKPCDVFYAQISLVVTTFQFLPQMCEFKAELIARDRDRCAKTGR